MSKIKFHNNNNYVFLFFFSLQFIVTTPPPSPQNFAWIIISIFIPYFPPWHTLILLKYTYLSQSPQEMRKICRCWHVYGDILERKCHFNGFHWIKTKADWEISKSFRNMLSFIMLLHRACSRQKSVNLVTIEQAPSNLWTGRPSIRTRRTLPKIVKDW